MTARQQPRWASKRETAEYLGVSLQTIDSLISRNVIRAYYVKRRVLIDLAEVDAAVKAGRAA